MKQRIQGNDMVSNEGGCIVFQNVGELNPSLIVEQNRMQRNGLALLNMTGPPLFGIYIQNSRLLTIANNFVGDSHGPIWVNTTTKILSNSIYANITNNVITRNSHGPSLFIEGNTSVLFMSRCCRVTANVFVTLSDLSMCVCMCVLLS
jgi:hypothetical protein